MNRRHLIALVAAASVAPAVALPAGADASSCFKTLPGPGDTSWAIQQDGTQDAPLQWQGGSNFDADHGKLTVNGVAYPKVLDDTCTTGFTSINYPQRTVGGITVSRHLASVDGRVRRMEILTNKTDVSKSVDVDFAVRVLPSQHSINSSSGNAAVTSIDHWSTHKNDGTSHPFLQWSDGESTEQATVVSLGDEAAWQPKTGTMPDATLHYEDLFIPANKAIRLVHVNGTTGSAESSKTAARDGATPFTGLHPEQMAQVVNWGNDPDKDGVSKGVDECPGVSGNQADGCLLFDVDPGDDGQPAPPAGDQNPVTPPGGTPEGGAQPVPGASDTTAPRMTVSKLGRRAKRTRLTRKGLRPRVRCDEACSISVKVKTRKRGARKAKTVLTKKATTPSTAARTLRLKLKPGALRRLARKRVTLVITATDTAGNRSSITRVVRLGR